MFFRMFAAAVCGLFFSGASIAYTLDTTPTAATNVTGLWWNPSESGWGVSLTQQGSVVFVAMYTYDASRAPIWYVASACAVSGSGCSGDLYRVTGGAPPTQVWSGSAVNVSKVGSLTLSFSDTNNGAATFSIDGVPATKVITRQFFGQQPPAENVQRTKTELLVGGTWSYTYAIGSAGFTNRYTFISISQDSKGQWYANGQGEFGDPVAGSYYANTSDWAVLDPGTIIDRFFTFTFLDNNRISGCYYQINPPGSTNFSNCYSMSGFRSPPKSNIVRADPVAKLEFERQALEAGLAPNPDGAPAAPEIIEKYLNMRSGR